MTRVAQSDNIKPIFWGIAVVMVVLCLCATGAFESLSRRNSTIPNLPAYGIFGLSLFAVFNAIISLGFLAFFGLVEFTRSLFATNKKRFCFHIATYCGFTFFACTIFSRTFTLAYPALFACAVFSHRFTVAYLTVSRIPVFCAPVLVKFRQWLNFLAMTAGLCYDGLKHGRFSLNGCVFKPLQDRTCTAFCIIPVI